MAESRFYDEHTLMLTFPDTLTEPERRCQKLFEILLTTARSQQNLNGLVSPDEFYRQVKVCVPRNVENKHYGYAYVWFESSAIYNMLSGFKPDGTPHVEKRPDPNWVPRSKPNSSLTMDQITSALRQKTLSWEDFDDEDEEVAPLISVALPPLLTFPADDQIKMEGRAHVKHNAEILPNKLICLKVPAGVTTEQVRLAMLPHATITERDVVTAKGKKKHLYPRVEEQRKKNAGSPRVFTVEFDPSTRDAQFAKLIICKMMVQVNNRQEMLIWRVCNAK
jgi:hypothetical protein